MKKLLLCVLVLLTQYSFPMQQSFVKKTQTPSSADIAALEAQIMAQEEGSEEEVYATMADYFEDQDAKAPPVPPRGGDSSDGQGDEEPDAREQARGSSSGSGEKTNASTQRTLTLSTKAAALLGVDSVDLDDTSSAGNKSPRGLRGSKSDRSSNGRKKGFSTIGRRGGQKSDMSLDDSEGSLKKSPRAKLSKRDAQSKKERFTQSLALLQQRGKKLEEAQFDKLLKAAQDDWCMTQLVDWCAQHPDKVSIPSYCALVMAYLDSLSVEDVEDVTLKDPAEKSEEKKKISTKIFQRFGQMVAPTWHKVKKQFQKVLDTLDEYGKKLEMDARALIPKGMVPDEHLAKAISFAVASFDEELETDLCAKLRVIAEKREKAALDELLEIVFVTLIEAEERLDDEELAHLQIVKQAYRGGKYSDSALIAAFVTHYAPQLENDFFDKVLGLARMFDTQTPDRPHSDKTCQSVLKDWVIDHKARLSRFSFGLIADEALDRGDEEKGAAKRRRPGLYLYDHWASSRKVSGKFCGAKMELLDSILSGDATSYLLAADGVDEIEQQKQQAKKAAAQQASKKDQESVPTPNKLYDAQKLASIQQDESTETHSRLQNKYAQFKRDSMQLAKRMTIAKQGAGVSPVYDDAMRARLDQVDAVEEDTNARLAAKADLLRKGGASKPSVMPKQADVVGERDGAAEEKPQARVAARDGLKHAPSKSALVDSKGSDVNPVYDSAMVEKLKQVDAVEEDTNARLASKAALLRQGSRPKVPLVEQQGSDVAPVYDEAMRTKLKVADVLEEDTNARLARKADALRGKPSLPLTRKEERKVEDVLVREQIEAIDAGDDDEITKIQKKMDVMSGPDIDLSHVSDTHPVKNSVFNFLGKFRKEQSADHSFGYDFSSTDERQDVRWGTVVSDKLCFLCNEELDEAGIRINQKPECQHKIHRGCANKIKAHTTECYCGICNVRIHATALYKQVYKVNERKEQHDDLFGERPAAPQSADQTSHTILARDEEPSDEQYIFEESGEVAVESAAPVAVESRRREPVLLDDDSDDSVEILRPAVSREGESSDALSEVRRVEEHVVLKSEDGISLSSSRKGKPLPQPPSDSMGRGRGRGRALVKNPEGTVTLPRSAGRAGSLPGTPVKGSPVALRSKPSQPPSGTAPRPPARKNDDSDDSWDSLIVEDVRKRSGTSRGSEDTGARGTSERDESRDTQSEITPKSPRDQAGRRRAVTLTKPPVNFLEEEGHE